MPGGNGETILLVDDEEIVLTSASALLSHLGYKVITANNGRQALRVDDLASIDLALLDIVMPEMGGMETAEHLREIQPGLPVIFATAYDKTHVAADSDRLVNSRIISKPFRINYLGRAIHQMLHA
jgi:CheY-like chemotaxis protein